MAYLVKDDYTLRISIDHLDRILIQAANTAAITPDAIREESELTAQAEVNAYLSKYYQSENEFLIDGGVNPDDRNKLVKKCVIDISLFNIFHTVNPRDVPENREKNYNDCIDMLKVYRDGELDFGLPIVEDPSNPGEPDVQRIMIDSDVRFVSKPFSDKNVFE